MATLDKAANIVLATCMGLQKTESCLIVADTSTEALANSFLVQAQELCHQAKLLSMQPRKVNGEEPTQDIAEAMKQSDVALLITSKSLSHTDARRNATTEHGVRMASFPGATKEMLERCIDIDYEAMRSLCKRLYDRLSVTKVVRVSSNLGTDIEIPVGRCFQDTGIYRAKGSFGNLPAGETGMGPAENKTKGVFYVDATMGFGILNSPLKLTVEDGYVTTIEGEEAYKLKDMLSPFGKEAYNIAEFAIGTNPEAEITGIVLENEKVLGTCHIAVGNNKSFGGTCEVGIHIDGIIKSPTVYFDDDLIMKDGTLMI